MEWDHCSRHGINVRYTKTWGKSYKIFMPLLKESGYYSKNPKLVLNFGHNYEREDIHILNRYITHIQDKVEMNQLFDKYNIQHPKTYYYPFHNLPKRGSCVIKERYGRGRGRGIVFTTFRSLKKRVLDSSMFIQDYIPFEKEYRVVNFIGHYRTRLKIPDNLNIKLKNSYTCTFKNYRDERLENFAHNICENFEVEYAGLDIGEYNGHLFAIEINSAAGINENSAHTLLHFLTNYYEKLR